MYIYSILILFFPSYQSSSSYSSTIPLLYFSASHICYNIPMFTLIDPNPNLPHIEQEIIDFWKEHKIFEKSVENRPEDKTWMFLDGPPFITGLPHYGTLLPSIAKDLFPRFWTMKGYRVRRVWGWDCHGLPAENKVEQKLGITRKKDIEEKIGVKKFIEECKLYVSTVSGEWEWYIDHVARWVDFKHAYRTMDLPYMESVMWVFKQMYEKDLIYKGLRVSLYCPHCSTPISNFEVAMDQDNYRMVTEPGTIYKYKLVDEDAYLLAWSTTPWTKLVTTALAINPKLAYVKVSQNGENYILTKSTLEMLKGEYKIVDTFKGDRLLGKKFEGQYDFFSHDKDKKLFEVAGGDFVTEGEGTGIVTLAAYGEEDLAVMKKENIQVALHLDDEGKFISTVPHWVGKYYLDVNEDIDRDLESRGLVYSTAPYEHTVPTCWRCHTRLIYAPQDAWYVDIQRLKPQLVQTNKAINWFPKHFKHGRFEKSIEAAPDWCISRSRYFGSPVPVWECKNGHRFVPGSIKELEQASGVSITDLHKPVIDEVTVKCGECKEPAHRVSEVLDSWIEAGSAPYAERHYPFGEEKDLVKFFPPDFIVEYTGQIRAWFYVLHVISNALFNSAAFKNVVVNGVILGTDGRKMSKNFGNYPDPKEMLLKYGGDALRLYFMASPVMRGEDIVISEEEYRNQIRSTLLPIFNVYNFFALYANTENWTPPTPLTSPSSSHVLDRWILSRLGSLEDTMTDSLDKYDTATAVSSIREFIDDWSRWYVRRSRNRVGDGFYCTSYHVLTTFSRLVAPIIPFTAEYLYKKLTNEESVHLTDWPQENAQYIDKGLEESMAIARQLVEEGHAFRKKNALKVRKPLLSLKLVTLGVTPKVADIPGEIWNVVLDELNIKNISVDDFHYPKVPVKVSPQDLNAEEQARDLVRQIQQERKNLGLLPGDKISLTLPSYPKKFEEFIKTKVLADGIKTGDTLTVVKL